MTELHPEDAGTLLLFLSFGSLFFGRNCSSPSFPFKAAFPAVF